MTSTRRWTSRPGRGARLPVLAAAAALLCLGATACTGDGSGGGAQPSPRPTSALAGTRLWTDPEGHAARQAREFTAAGRTDLADALAPLAGEPVATWLTGTEADPYARTRDLTSAAAAQGETAVLVVYAVPGRDCGQHSAGGAADVDAYLAWVGSLAAGIEERPAVVVLEPDAVAHAVEGCVDDAGARYRALAQAVEILQRRPGVRLYVDAGNASWVDDLDRLADALRDSGVERADGFALNVSNFETTAASAAYGRELSERLGGARFVVDTSRNGAGPPAGTGTGEAPSWCNPEGVRLGQPPTTDPGIDRVDALLWVKQPGDSDGECAPGDPPAGTFDLRHAGGLLGTPLQP